MARVTSYGDGPPTRFPSGATDARVDEALAEFRHLDPTRLIHFWDDFFTYTAGDWTVTLVGTGTADLGGGRGGRLSVATTGAAPDSTFLQLTKTAFNLTAGKKAFFATRFQLGDVSLPTVIAGLQTQDTTPLDATNAVYFRKPSGATAIELRVKTGASETIKSFASGLANDTMISLAWAYNGKDKVRAFLNNSLITAAPVDNVPFGQDLTLSFGLGNSSAVANSMVIDYMMATEER